MVVCRKCSVELVVGDNWAEGNARKSAKICRPCQAAYNREYREKNKGPIQQRRREYFEANAEVIRERDRLRYEDFQRKESSAKRGRAHYERNRPAVLTRASAWKKANPEKSALSARSYSARRRAWKIDQTPPDADDGKIEAFYALAATLTKATGQQYHVDHIKSLKAGGLHHQDNLVVMTAPLNLSKGAQHWPWLTWFNSPSD